MSNNDLGFQEQLELHLDDPVRKRVMITLLSGDKYEIDRRSLVTFLPRMVLILKGNDGEAYFPFEAICNVDVENLDQ